MAEASVRTVTFRPLTTDDVDRYARLESRVTAEEDWGEVWSPDEIEEELASSTAHLETRSRVAVLPDGELAGVAWLREMPGSDRAFLFLDVLMGHRGELDEQLLAWALDRLQEEVNDGALDVRHLDTIAEPHMQQRLGLFERHGFVPVRHFIEMERDLAEPIDDIPLADGLRLVPWDDSWSPAVREAHTEAFQDHWGSVAPTDERWQQLTVGAMKRPGLHRLAVSDDGTVAGYLLAGVYEHDWEVKGLRDAWIDTIGTRRAWRGKGVASALLVDVMRAMRDGDFTHASLGVDSESPTGATRVYERLGFRQTRTQVTLRRELD